MITTQIGKLIYNVLSKFRNASSLPGKIVLSLDKNYLKKIDTTNTYKIYVTGTNGKTSSTAYITKYLKRNHTVLTNDSGANMTQGITTTILRNVKSNKTKADFIVFEIDELFLNRIANSGLVPDLVLITNLSEDQIDRMKSLENVKSKILEPLKKYQVKTILTTDIYENDEEFFVRYNPSDGIMNGTQKKIFNSLDIFKQKNFYNALSVLEYLKQNELIKDISIDLLLDIVNEEEVLIGRMQDLIYKGKHTFMNLVKNPAGLELTLEELKKQTESFDLVFNIGKTDADGHNQDWILNYDFNNIYNNTKVKDIYLTGTLAGPAPSNTKHIKSLNDLNTEYAIFLPNYSKLAETLEYINQNK